MTVTVICAVIASSGFWAYISKRGEKKDVKTQMLIGLAHDRILFLGMCYIERGYITRDEYENLYEYLYRPYEKMGGNGSAKRVMQEVNKLPIHSQQT
nr:MAG TPA: holin protein [Caudoviricetes sp.]